jgi:hypothetical protein
MCEGHGLDTLPFEGLVLNFIDEPSPASPGLDMEIV